LMYQPVGPNLPEPKQMTGQKEQDADYKRSEIDPKRPAAFHLFKRQNEPEHNPCCPDCTEHHPAIFGSLESLDYGGGRNHGAKALWCSTDAIRYSRGPSDTNVRKLHCALRNTSMLPGGHCLGKTCSAYCSSGGQAIGYR